MLTNDRRFGYAGAALLYIVLMTLLLSLIFSVKSYGDETTLPQAGIGALPIGMTYVPVRAVSFAVVLTRADGNGLYTIGPTGSGANKIYNFLDAIPTNAKFLFIYYYAATSHSTDATAACSTSVNFQDLGNFIFGVGNAAANLASEVSNDSGMTVVPIDSTRIFKINWTATTTANSTHNLFIGLSGYSY